MCSSLDLVAFSTRVPSRQRWRRASAGEVAARATCRPAPAACFAVPVELTPSRRRVEHEPSREAGEDEVGEGRFVIATVRMVTWRYLFDRAAELVGQEPRPPTGWEPVERC